ncbi:MAG: multidrug MFS transporter [Rhodobacterales bacterium]|nr:MAG: multidrug MFS transporter [Rhodobacterales bacterium]
MPTKPLRKPEFVALIAMSFATIALAIDAMLPALPEIGKTLSPDNLNHAQLVITSFLLGLGLGTFFSGPLSDALGRRRVMLGGYAVYIIAALLASLAQSLELLLAARVLQGLGASGPRVVAMAIVRDLYVERQMAQLTSFVMTVFMLVPVIAPSIGALILLVAGWRTIFFTFVVFAIALSLWFTLRQPETLPPEKRRKIALANLWGGMVEVLSHPVVRVTIVVQSLLLGALYSALSSSQQIFDITFGRGDSFALWFGAVAIVSGFSALINARLVVRLGMQPMIRTALACVMLISAVMLALFWGGGMPDMVAFPAFVFFKTSVFFMIGMTLGNLNAIAMQPMGHIAGMAASMMSAIATVLGLAIAVPIGLAFDGTPLPLMCGVFVCVSLALGLMQLIRHEPT